jgi:tetratricopeptide (TPR) repeat protein
MKWIAVVLLAIVTTAHAEPSEPERLYTAGQAAYDAKQYDAALTAWERSYQLSRLPALLFNIAQAHRLRANPGDCTMAVEAYRNFTKLDPTSAQRGTAEGFIAELGACATAESHAAVTAPWVAPTPPAGGPVDHGGSNGKKLASYVVGGASLVMLGAGIYFGGRADSLGKEVTAACERGCLFSDIEAKDAEGRSAATKQYVFYGIGGAGLAAAGILYYLGSREHASGVAIAPRGGGAMATWSTRW